METKKSTIVLNLLGLLSVIATCIFTCLALNRFLTIIDQGFIDDDNWIQGTFFVVLALVFLIIAFLSFIAEIYRSISELEKIVYEQGKNR